MNQSLRAEHLRRVTHAYAETIDIPRFNAVAIRSHMRATAPAGVAWRWAGAALAAALLVIAFAFGSRAVVAQVERMLQAFATIGGQTVPVAVSTVSLEQARRDMPFAVIAPAAIPPGFDATINELNVGSSRLDSRLLFQYRSGNGAPGLTIMESAARGATPQSSMRLWMTQSIRGTAPPVAPPPLPNAASGQHAFVQFGRNGQVMRQVRLQPLIWTVRGTRIDLISPPGLLSGEQLAAIRRAMSH